MSVPSGYRTTYDELDELRELRARDGARTGRPFDDDGNAHRFVDAHGSDVRYLPGVGWHSWDGTRWLLDDSGEPMRRARAVVAALREEEKGLRAERGAEDGLVKALHAHVRTSGSRRALEAMIVLARTDERVLVDVGALDVDPLLLNAPNGTIDLRIGELRPHERADLLTRRVAVPYDSDAIAPTWAAFLERVQPDEDVRAYLQRIAGAAAVGDNRDELAHVFHGRGANGKTKFCETIRACLGDYAAVASPELFLTRRPAAAQPELVRLRGVRLLMASETSEGSRLDVALVKALTGGDTIAGRFLYANDVVEFQPAFSPWLRTNHRPAIRERSDAVWRRVRLVPFAVTIPADERDSQLQGRLYAELPGVLAWIVEGARAYLAEGLSTPEQVGAATDAYRLEEDVLGAFIAERCIVDEKCSVAFAALYEAWKAWASAHGEDVGTSTGFARALSDAGFESGKRSGQRVRLGLALRGPLDDEGSS